MLYNPMAAGNTGLKKREKTEQLSQLPVSFSIHVCISKLKFRGCRYTSVVDCCLAQGPRLGPHLGGK